MDAVNLRLPNITAADADGKIAQMQSFMFQMVEQLNFALNSVNDASDSPYSLLVSGNNSSGKVSEKLSDSEFNNIKQLIIQSGEILNSYYEQFVYRLKSELSVYSGDFGEYLRDVEQLISIGADKIQQNIDDVQIVNKDALITEAFITAGYIGNDENGIPQYGFSVRQSDTFGKLLADKIEGKNIQDMTADELKAFLDEITDYTRLATFTADGLKFYDNNNTPVAYIKSNADTHQSKLYIVKAEIVSELVIGGYVEMTTNGLAFKWRGSANA